VSGEHPGKLRTQETILDRCPPTYNGGPIGLKKSSMLVGWPVSSGKQVPKIKSL